MKKKCRLLWCHTLAFWGSLQAPWLHHALLSAQSPTVPTRRLDALYAKHKGKQITPQQALEELTTLVGQTTVEQAGLVLSNIQTGQLPAGCAVLACPPACTSFPPPRSPCTPYTPPYRWVEYFDPQRNLPYSSVVKCPPGSA